MATNVWDLNVENVPDDVEDELIRKAAVDYDEDEEQRKRKKQKTTYLFDLIFDDKGSIVTTPFHAEPRTTITKIIHSYAEKHYFQEEDLLLFHKGRNITQEKTVAEADIKDGDEIEVRVRKKKPVSCHPAPGPAVSAPGPAVSAPGPADPAPGDDHIIMTSISQFDKLPRIHVCKEQRRTIVKFAVFQRIAHAYIDGEFLCAIHKDLDVRLADANEKHIPNFPHNFLEKHTEFILSMFIVRHTDWHVE